jgi:hypothetical protein
MNNYYIQIIWQFFRGFIADHKFKFIFTIIFGWYARIVMVALSAFYYFLKSLQDSGILKNIEDFIFIRLDNITLIVQHCMPNILNLKEAFQCLKGIPF